MKRIYLAGKYSADNIMDVLENIRLGQEMAHRLLIDGFAVFCPFLDYQLAFFDKPCAKLTKKHFQDNSMAWVAVSDALLILDGWENSGGTKREIEGAKSLGIPVFFSYIDLLEGDIFHSKKTSNSRPVLWQCKKCLTDHARQSDAENCCG